MKIEYLKSLIQSCNINFLIGSGLSKPYLDTLGDIEKWLTDLDKEKEDIDEQIYNIIKASIFKVYFDNVIYPNVKREIRKRKADFDVTIKNYKELLLHLNNIVLKRNNTLLTKQINLFTTNIDLFFEKSLEDTSLEFNDGFKGRLEPVFDLTNFQKSYSKTSLHYDNISEIPVFNLLKVHGSINWRQKGNKAITLFQEISQNLKPIKEAIDKIDTKYFISTDKTSKDEDVTLDVLLERAALPATLEDISINSYDDFFEEYEELVIVNPTKAKFKETVLEEQYYEMMRIYANSLEKVNTLLFVMGFSFADEHIRSITIRAANSNPTLQIIVFAYNDNARAEILKNLGTFNNENIIVLTPTLFVDNCGLDDEEKKKLRKRIDVFDCTTINSEIFSALSQIIKSIPKS